MKIAILYKPVALWGAAARRNAPHSRDKSRSGECLAWRLAPRSRSTLRSRNAPHSRPHPFPGMGIFLGIRRSTTAATGISPMYRARLKRKMFSW